MTDAFSTFVLVTHVPVAAKAWHCEAAEQVGKQANRPEVDATHVLAMPALFDPQAALLVHACVHQSPPAAFVAHVPDAQLVPDVHLSPIFPLAADPELEPEPPPELDPVPASVAQAALQWALPQATSAVVAGFVLQAGNVWLRQKAHTASARHAVYSVQQLPSRHMPHAVDDGGYPGHVPASTELPLLELPVPLLEPLPPLPEPLLPLPELLLPPPEPLLPPPELLLPLPEPLPPLLEPLLPLLPNKPPSPR